MLAVRQPPDVWQDERNLFLDYIFAKSPPVCRLNLVSGATFACRACYNGPA